MNIGLAFVLSLLFSTVPTAKDEQTESIASVKPLIGSNDTEQNPNQDVEALDLNMPPGSEIMLFDIESNGQSIQFINGKNISQAVGYDSQPKFSIDGKYIYYTHHVNGQMDIYQYEVSNGQRLAYMATKESEYSPTPLPESDGLSVIQVDDKGNQYVVILDREAKKDHRVQRYSDFKQLGYFNWTEGQNLWSFVLNDTAGGDLYLQGGDKNPIKILDHIGRSFIVDKKYKTLFFVDKNPQPWRIKSVQAEDTLVKDVMPLPDGVEDFTLDSKGRFWAGRGNTLFVSSNQQRWFIAKEFDLPGLSQISRISTNPSGTKIAIVFAETPHNE